LQCENFNISRCVTCSLSSHHLVFPSIRWSLIFMCLLILTQVFFSGLFTLHSMFVLSQRARFFAFLIWSSISCLLSLILVSWFLLVIKLAGVLHQFSHQYVMLWRQNLGDLPCLSYISVLFTYHWYTVQTEFSI
jgi:hypothetical protein